MKNIGIKMSLYLNYFVFAILLNSVGLVILQVQQNFGIAKDSASILEGFKDIPIAITSFILASFLPKIGLKNAMLIALAIVAIICSIVPFANEFWYFKLLFLSVGISFALIKISVFATIGIITKNAKEHGSFMNILEAVFMGGILLGGFMFSYFVDDANPKSTTWTTVYWLLSGLSVFAFILLFFSKLDESEAQISNTSATDNFSAMLQLVTKHLIIIFLFSIFFYVLIEQSFSTWFPTFYKEILNTPSSMAIQAGSVLAGATLIGRLLSGFVLLRVKWIYFLSVCLIAIAVIVLVVLPMAKNSVIGNVTWANSPLVVYLLPLMGLFLAPIYPTLNSTILSSLPKHQHAGMSGLIVVFSALGGTIGSMITGQIFEHFDGTTAFYFSLIPISIIFILIWMLDYILKRQTPITAK